MKTLKRTSITLCVVLAGILCFTGCSKEETDLLVPADNSSDVQMKAGSTYVMLESFTLFAVKWTDISAGAPYWKNAGFTHIWFPPCSRAADTYGYLPTQWYDWNNWRGTEAQLKSAISAVKNNGMTAMADVVLNHRNGNATAGADFVNPAFTNNSLAVVSNDECGCGTGGTDQGTGLAVGRDLNHNNASVQTLCKQYVSKMLGLGFNACRYDMVLGYNAATAKLYKSSGNLNVGEYWVDSRTQINSWINTSTMCAFDFTTYNRLKTAVAGNYSVLAGVPGLIGINKAKAVTFAGNHDAASSGLLGNVYILTHPGIPCVYIEDWNSYSSQISTLIALRKEKGIGQTSNVVVNTATSSVYAATIDGVLAMKIGPGSWSPGTGWTLRTSGVNYAVWTK